MADSERRDKVLGHVDESRRAFLKKLLMGGAFVIPAVASFSMTGLGTEKAYAYPSNQNFYYEPGTPGEENCYGQTIAYLEHVNAEQFQIFVECNGLTQHGIGSLANQWCRQASNGITPDCS